MSIGQFNQWVGSQLMASGAVQIWPGTPVAKPLVENGAVTGVRLTDQGVDKQGNPDAAFMPGMDIRAALTVIGDGPVGPVGRQIDEQFGMPQRHERHEWAVGMKFVIDLREDCGLEPGTVLHTFGYPEPEIFGFLYVHPDRVATVGIFVPSWFDSPARTAYRYLQHYMMHPYIWQYLQGGTLRSWGAKSLLESGRRGEPWLAGNGYARIGEGSGSTNVLTGSGVDEGWMTGTQLAEGVLDLLRIGAAADTGHWCTSNIKPIYGLKILKGRIISVHLKDKEKFGESHDVPYGEGVADIKALLDELKAQGFNGNVSIEYEYKMENNSAEVKQCIDYVRKYGEGK
jgi:electron-transferring-flavoprotein dehydrogenase